MTPLVLVSLTLVPTSAALCAIAARLMRARSFGQSIRPLGPERHATKAGTPTMGGVVLLALWVAAVGVLSAWYPPTRATAFVLVAGGAFAAIGAADDLISVSRRRSMGLSAIAKIGLSTLAVLGLFFLFGDVVSVPMRIPFVAGTITLPPAATFAFVWLVFLSTTNGANLTDGLDGLAAGVVVLILAGLLLLARSQESVALGIPLIAGLVGFLWVNAHPADLFLGDIGSFFLGGVIAALSLATGVALFLPLIAGVFVLEVGSVILQVSIFKTTGRRLFRMSPLHHHFEPARGPRREHVLQAFSWPEGKVVVRFWIVQAGFVGLALLGNRL